MRTGLLSDHERNLIYRYLKDNLRLNGFAVLKHLCVKHLPQIKEDLALINIFLTRIEGIDDPFALPSEDARKRAVLREDVEKDIPSWFLIPDEEDN